MKIDSFSPQMMGPEPGGVTSASRLARAERPEETERTSEAERAGDHARISVDRATVERLKSNVMALPEVRQERVAALQAALRDGTYRVSEEEAAEAVFAEWFR